jgi:hypothetical protein
MLIGITGYDGLIATLVASGVLFLLIPPGWRSGHRSR